MVVERLRSKGALIVGKTNMHEIGIGVTGGCVGVLLIGFQCCSTVHP